MSSRKSKIALQVLTLIASKLLAPNTQFVPKGTSHECYSCAHMLILLADATHKHYPWIMWPVRGLGEKEN